MLAAQLGWPHLNNTPSPITMQKVEKSQSGTTWMALSSSQKKTMKKSCEIPTGFLSRFLADSKTDLLKFCRLNLPSTASNRIPVPVEDFFSAVEPIDIDILHRQRLLRFQIPHGTTVAKLRTLAYDMMAQGARSVQYAHIPGEKTRYPIWVIELWAKLISLKEQQAPWTGVERWLQSQAHTDEDAEQVKAVLAVMGNVPYDMKKTAFSDGKPIYDLWRLLGNNWTNSTDIDNMLDFLRLQIVRRGIAQSFVVLPVHFTEKLTQAIESSHRGQRDGRTWRWLDKVGEQVFSEGKTILTVVHLGVSMNMAHWVPLAFDGSQNLLLYGNSLDLEATVPSPILSTYRSWAALYSQKPLCTDKLSVATQQDGHSCGPLAANALRNFVFNDPLVESSRVGFERMKIFHEIVLETLCHVRSRTPELLAAPAHLVLQQVKPGLIDGQINDSDSTTDRKRVRCVDHYLYPSF